MKGECPVCEAQAGFTAADPSWFRDSLFCDVCGSLPRDRALALVLTKSLPGWRRLSIHESSPDSRGISRKLLRDARHYTASHYFPDRPPGEMVNGFRNENLERQSFEDACFDLVVTLDVMEHVNDPTAVLREVRRTLRPGGCYLFTVPTYKGLVASERRAEYLPNGSVKHFAEPEYHGNPVSEQGSLVTFHYGYDLPELIATWTDFDTRVLRFHDRRRAILGEFTEVYLCEASAVI
jgi:SAM-dependent methyltransferase